MKGKIKIINNTEKDNEESEKELNERAYDEAMASHYAQEYIDDIKSEGIDEFQQERLQEYYLDNKNLPQLIDRHLDKAKKLIDANFAEAGFVFSFTVVEIILKSVFLKPILYGSFMYQNIADLVVKEILRARDDSIRKILFHVLNSSANFDFETYKRPMVKVTLWEEIKNVRIQRNIIIHSGKIVPLDKAKYVYRIAVHLNKIIFPKLLDNVGLKIVAKEISLKQ